MAGHGRYPWRTASERDSFAAHANPAIIALYLAEARRAESAARQVTLWLERLAGHPGQVCGDITAHPPHTWCPPLLCGDERRTARQCPGWEPARLAEPA